MAHDPASAQQTFVRNGSCLTQQDHLALEGLVPQIIFYVGQKRSEISRVVCTPSKAVCNVSNKPKRLPGKQKRANFREQTAEIARDKAKEVDNPLVAKHAKQTKHQKYEKRILTFRNEQKRKSKPGDALKRENRQSRNTSQSDVRWR